MTSIAKCPPPRRFTPAGIIAQAELALEEPPFIKRRPRTKQQAAGIGYERKVQRFLSELYPNYVPGPWLKFLPSGEGRWRWCQPDGLLVDLNAGSITLVEIKLRHTHHSWWQIRRLYEPVTRALFGADWTYSAVEVVRWYDGTVPFPERYSLAPKVEGIEDGRFGIHILTP